MEYERSRVTLRRHRRRMRQKKDTNDRYGATSAHVTSAVLAAWRARRLARVERRGRGGRVAGPGEAAALPQRLQRVQELLQLGIGREVPGPGVIRHHLRHVAQPPVGIA